jgi:hypothetical protein
LDAIKKWKTKFEHSDVLTSLGEEEMQNLGYRYAKRLKELFENLSPWEVQIKTTKSNRTQQSAAAFINGIFADWKLKPDMSASDEFLRYYRFCDLYKKVNKMKIIDVLYAIIHLGLG